MPTPPSHLGSQYRISTATLIGVAISAYACLSAFAADLDICVYTDHAHPVRAMPGSAIKVVYLDAPSKLQTELALKLPMEEQSAASIVRQRLDQGGKAWQLRMQQAYQGVVDAWSLGVEKLPAVVVDHRFVIYGESDIGKALGRIEHFRKAQP